MSDFSKQVHKVVKAIPPGKVMSYREVAAAAGRPRAWRAVGRVLSRNYDEHIPCHRVIKSDGRLGGYNRGKDLKRKLLQQEQLPPAKKGSSGALRALQEGLLRW